MPRAKKRIHYIYKTTCMVTGRYYIGMHSTNNLDDGYLGSGRRLCRSIRKYGKDSHTKEILEYCDSRELLAERERFIVTLELVHDNMCMNLVNGGTGGNTCITPEQYEYAQYCGRIGGLVHSQKMITDTEYNTKYRHGASNRLKQLYKDGKIIMPHYDWTGKKHKPETIEKMKLSAVGKHVGEKNSQYGKPRSEETKKKISESMKNHITSKTKK